MASFIVGFDNNIWRASSKNFLIRDLISCACCLALSCNKLNLSLSFFAASIDVVNDVRTATSFVLLIDNWREFRIFTFLFCFSLVKSTKTFASNPFWTMSAAFTKTSATFFFFSRSFFNFSIFFLSFLLFESWASILAFSISSLELATKTVALSACSLWNNTFPFSTIYANIFLPSAVLFNSVATIADTPVRIDIPIWTFNTFSK